MLQKVLHIFETYFSFFVIGKALLLFKHSPHYFIKEVSVHLIKYSIINNINILLLCLIMRCQNKRLHNFTLSLDGEEVDCFKGIDHQKASKISKIM